uniref:Uncharacterized protein n=1 Tax=viral metagenome TaxID=1070528 RepID=A0A6H1ZT77_9ZZZZ
MTKDQFDAYKNNLLRKAADIRRAKESEYFSTQDLLGNFRKIASFRGRETPVTIMDLAAKSIVSISDMVNAEWEYEELLIDERFTLEQWDEKFIDAINYLLKLYASIREERG